MPAARLGKNALLTARLWNWFQLVGGKSHPRLLFIFKRPTASRPKMLSVISTGSAIIDAAFVWPGKNSNVNESTFVIIYRMEITTKVLALEAIYFSDLQRLPSRIRSWRDGSFSLAGVSSRLAKFVG